MTARFSLNAAAVPFKLKSNDCLEHVLVEPIHIHPQNLDDRGKALNSFGIATSTQN